MDGKSNHIKNRGGRPSKEVKRSLLLGVKCTILEAFIIKGKANKAGLTVSEYLRKMGINGKIDSHQKTLPKEVLLFTATLNHAAANLNQIAKKRNQNAELNPVERAELHHRSNALKQLAGEIKKYLV